MTRLLLTVPLLLTAGCGHNLLQGGPPRQPPWRATGQQPVWEVLVQDGVIAFRPAPGGRDRTWRAVRPRVHGDVTIWRTGRGNQGIEIVARRTGCTLPGEGRGTQLRYEQYVTVKLGRDGPEYLGCGGRVFAISSGAPGR
jgi:uncharacterized membrane protein